MMTASEMPATDLPLLADLLSLPGAEAELPPNLTPQQRKERTFDLLIGGLVILAREVPVLMVFEDAHWMDPTTLELLDRLIRRVETLPVLVVVTFRPEFQASWTTTAKPAWPRKRSGIGTGPASERSSVRPIWRRLHT
jgi:predicted ATPase